MCTSSIGALQGCLLSLVRVSAQLNHADQALRSIALSSHMRTVRISLTWCAMMRECMRQESTIIIERFVN